MLIAGIDEAGRGPCFGPMVLGVCSILKADEEKLVELGVKDSKQLTPIQRQLQYPQIKQLCHESATAHLSPLELDALMDRKSLNEIEAMAIGRLLNNLTDKPEVVFIDSPDIIAANFGKRIKNYLSFDCHLRTEHKADNNYPITAAASVLAKVERDAVISELAAVHGDIGSGYSHDARTIAFLEQYLRDKNELPVFCRAKWETSKRMLAVRRQTTLFSTPSKP